MNDIYIYLCVQTVKITNNDASKIQMGVEI